jgi:predicted nucleic acid-binding Zn ribbon protein
MTLSSTLLRLGLWTTLITVVLYVLHETYEGMPAAEFFATPMLQKVLVVSVSLIVAGVIVRLFEKGKAKVIPKNRCVVCHTPIVPGAIYCRNHLRSVLAREDERERTQIRKRVKS